MDVYLMASNTYFGPNTHWASQQHLESIVCSTAPLPVQGVTGQAGSLNAVDSSGPTVIWKEGERLGMHYSYSGDNTAGFPFQIAAVAPYRKDYKDFIDLTDSAGHGILIATQKLYFYSSTGIRFDWEATSSVLADGVFNVNTYYWNIELEYRWKEVPEAEYLQILIENTTVN
jgi:hypothetical protein